MKVTYTVDMHEPAPVPEDGPTGVLQTFRDRYGREPQVGDWYAICCHLDLRQISDAETLRRVIEDCGPDNVLSPAGVWATQEDALQDLC